MGKQSVLSSAFNQSLGYLPVLITILLCSILRQQDISVYTGAAVGLAGCCCLWAHRGTNIPPLILYCTTGMLLLLAGLTLLSVDYCPPPMLPLMLEICSLLLSLGILLSYSRLLRHYGTRVSERKRKLFAQGMEAATVSARMLLIFVSLHLFIIVITLPIAYPLGDTSRLWLYQLMPSGVFLITILFNQASICYFNHKMQNTVFVPIVNKQGDVIGKALAEEVIGKKSRHMHPVIRIAIAAHGMLYLTPRPCLVSSEKSPNSTIAEEKIDLPMEHPLLFGESLEQGIENLLQKTLPDAPRRNLRFNLMYHFENETTNRLVYLFTLHLDDDDTPLYTPLLKNGKLWTFQQIEQNLHHNLFSNSLEHEYELLLAQRTITSTP